MGTHRAASAAVPAPLAPRCLCSPAAASPEFTHINVKAFLLAWGLEIRSAGSCRLWEVRKPLLALRPPPTSPLVGLRWLLVDCPGVGEGGLSSFLQRAEGETEAQRSKRAVSVPELAPEL